MIVLVLGIVIAIIFTGLVKDQQEKYKILANWGFTYMTIGTAMFLFVLSKGRK